VCLCGHSCDELGAWYGAATMVKVKTSTRLVVWLVSGAIAVALMFVVEARYLPLVLPGPLLAGALLLARLESGALSRNGGVQPDGPRQSRLMAWAGDHGLCPTAEDVTGIEWRSSHPWTVSVYASLLIGALLGLTTTLSNGRFALGGIVAVTALSVPVMRITFEVERRRYRRRVR